MTLHTSDTKASTPHHAQSGSPCTVVYAEVPKDSIYFPVAIIGAGACGLSAAIALRDAGIDCIVLERDAIPSGSTALSSGFIPAPCTSIQRHAGIEDDSPALFATDILAKTHGTAAPHLVQAYAHAIGPAIDNLALQHGIPFELLEGFRYPGHSVLRMHAVPEKTGASLVNLLEAAAIKAGADLITQATVRTLWFNKAHRVEGLSFNRPDGSVEHLRCDTIILACNGFGGNAAMVHDLLPAMQNAPFAGHAGNDGSAIAWGRALGARLADLGGYQGHGSWATPHGTLISWAIMMEGGIQLNQLGNRFHDETLGYSEAAVNVLAQPGHVAWNVFDAPLLELARTFPDFREAEKAGAVKTCASLASLAALIGCPEDAAAAACAQTNRALLQPINSESLATTPAAPKRALQTPLYAVQVTGALFHTQGGLDIDSQCRVLQEDGTPFTHLLAAGGAARGVSGNAVWGYLSGNGLLSAVAGGTIAAQTAIGLCKLEPVAN